MPFSEPLNLLSPPLPTDSNQIQDSDSSTKTPGLQMCWLSPHTRDPPNPDRSWKNKKQNEFIISTHMAGTWMSEGITKDLSVWMGMTVGKRQTITVYTIRFV